MDLMEAIRGRRSIRKYRADLFLKKHFRYFDGGVEMVSFLGQYAMLEVIVVKDRR